jgi:hypothetical protein
MNYKEFFKKDVPLAFIIIAAIILIVALIYLSTKNKPLIKASEHIFNSETSAATPKNSLPDTGTTNETENRVLSASSSRQEPPTGDDSHSELKLTPVSTGTFSYAKNDRLFSVTKKEFNVLDEFNISKLVKNSLKCGTDNSEAYFIKILSGYSPDEKGTEYDFTYKGETQDSGVWTVTVIPNKIGYGNLLDFENDFRLCEAGGDRYPALVSKKNLLFVSACSAGSDDSTGRPHGCDIIMKTISPTIKLK